MLFVWKVDWLNKNELKINGCKDVLDSLNHGLQYLSLCFLGAEELLLLQQALSHWMRYIDSLWPPLLLRSFQTGALDGKVLVLISCDFQNSRQCWSIEREFKKLYHLLRTLRRFTCWLHDLEGNLLLSPPSTGKTASKRLYLLKLECFGRLRHSVGIQW